MTWLGVHIHARIYIRTHKRKFNFVVLECVIICVAPCLQPMIESISKASHLSGDRKTLAKYFFKDAADLFT